ncbi:VTT domain-containing protein [Clostridium sp.]|uniref:TVP38/TMEM64 family protein n=1 Tax=Clostridium sp. TaxID=1506 RepID=UPI0025B9A64F|nr:VTT domain-containing protein [Clostridium sp.]MCI9070969.1 VTT domain-containing protein [Clostridium sp.]
MKNKKIFYGVAIIFILTFMVATIFLFKDKVALDFSIEKMQRIIESKKFSELIFISLWSLRLILFIPGVTLMILGGLIFDPSKAFLLSMIGIVLSDILVFLLAKSKLLSGFRNKLENKYKDIIDLIEKYNYKILGIGVLCPVAPTDAIVFLSSYVGMKFSRFLVVFIIANIPALFLYSNLGESFQDSNMNTIFIIITLIISGILSIKLWNNLKRKKVSTI